MKTVRLLSKSLNCLHIIFTFDGHKQLVFLLNLAVVKQYRQYLKKGPNSY